MAIDSWNPAQYDLFKSERSQPFFDLLALVEPESKMRVVDLGCGTGELTRAMHERLQPESILGCDNSPAMLTAAAQHVTAGLTFEFRDLVDIRDGRAALPPADLILANASLQWCGDHPKLFRKLHQNLRSGGQLAVQMPMNHDYITHTTASIVAKLPEFRARLNETDREPSLLTPEQYATLLFDLGFARQSVRLQVYGHQLATRDGLIDWVKGTLLTYYQSRLGPGDFARFLSVYRERLFAAVPDKRPFFYPFKRVLIWGRLPAT